MKSLFFSFFQILLKTFVIFPLIFLSGGLLFILFLCIYLPLIGSLSETELWKFFPFLVYRNIFWTKVFLFLSFYFAGGVVSFYQYGFDKRNAAKGQWRIPERSLHRQEMLGGWLGAFWAQKVFRHKTQKESYRSDFWLIGVFHLALLLALLVPNSVLPTSWTAGLAVLIGSVGYWKVVLVKKR